MFEKLKKRMQERLEKNGVKIPNISYTDKNGVVHTEDIILVRSKLPLIGDWARAYTPVNEDNSWNIPNVIFGGRRNLVKFVIVMAIVGMILFAFYNVFTQYETLVELCKPYMYNFIIE